MIGNAKTICAIYCVCPPYIVWDSEQYHSQGTIVHGMEGSCMKINQSNVTKKRDWHGGYVDGNVQEGKERIEKRSLAGSVAGVVVWACSSQPTNQPSEKTCTLNYYYNYRTPKTPEDPRVSYCCMS